MIFLITMIVLHLLKGNDKKQIKVSKASGPIIGA